MNFIPCKINKMLIFLKKYLKNNYISKFEDNYHSH